MAQGRNPNVGRRGAGSPIAKSGIRPPSRTGSASGYFVGTGVNRKTAASPQHKPSRSAPSTNYTRQAQQFVRQSPEPFRNPTRAANPMSGNVPSVRQTINPLGGRVMSQSEMNTATGHSPSYRPKGYHAATSGFPTKGVRRAGNSHEALGSGWKSNKPTGGAKLMQGLTTTVGGFSDRGLVQGPGIPVRLLPSRARKGSIPQG